jgi:hypothetical protein
MKHYKSTTSHDKKKKSTKIQFQNHCYKSITLQTTKLFATRDSLTKIQYYYTLEALIYRIYPK